MECINGDPLHLTVVSLPMRVNGTDKLMASRTVKLCKIMEFVNFMGNMQVKLKERYLAKESEMDWEWKIVIDCGIVCFWVEYGAHELS